MRHVGFELPVGRVNMARSIFLFLEHAIFSFHFLIYFSDCCLSSRGSVCVSVLLTESSRGMQ